MSEQDDNVAGQENAAGIRKQLDDALAELKVFRAEKRHNVYREAGLAESAFDVVDTIYDGALDPTTVREFATAKGFALNGATVEPTASTPDPAAQRESGEEKLAQVASGALPVRDPSIDDEIAKAQAEGNWQKFNELSAQKLMAG